jgi:hypothetical protein
LLVGLSVNAVALAFAIAAVPVEVYCVCANAVPSQNERQTIDHMLNYELFSLFNKNKCEGRTSVSTDDVEVIYA